MVENSQDNQVVVDMEASASLPSSSSARLCKYDVFLSFRGPDTRKGITVEIRDQLQSRGVITFMDDRDLEPGDPISRKLIEAIEGSRFAIVILSREYASSAWCLEELVKICECMKDENRVLPLFYNVKPSDVRYQTRSFGEAFHEHETSRRQISDKMQRWKNALRKVASFSGWDTKNFKNERELVEESSGRHTSEKVQRWKDALSKVASFSGWDSNSYKTDTELVEAVVDSVCKRIQPHDVEFTMSTGDFEEYEATRKAMGEVMKVLTDDDVTAIGVYGMGGVGKTTLVKHVAAKCRKSGIFHDVIMAVVSQNPDFKKLQDELAEQLGFKLSENTEMGRIGRLNKEIMRREKLLIILDDVWGRTELSKIGIPSYKELQKFKSKVLLTTRRLNVCHAMNCQEKISLNVLSKEDSLTLFLRNARIMSFESTTFEKVVKRVAGECKGLPIALIAVARALGDKHLVEWEKAAQRLEKSQTANPDHGEDAFECIKLSYDYLKDEEYKSFFLLCCLFPEDDVINIEDLFRYAIGIGLFRDAETIYEARGTAHTVVKHLIDSSLLLDGKDDRYVRMHDVVRDTAMRIAECEDGHGFLVKAGCGLKDWSCRSHKYLAISLMANNLRSLPDKLICPKLQILLLQENRDLYEIPETFFQSRNELRVLDLSGTNISLLPQSFSLLTKLQSLRLDFCGKVINISIVGKLKKLEILSMRHYPLTELSREIGNLTNLRMLDICGRSSHGGGIVTIPSEVISKLHRLEELYMMYCGFVNWESPIEGEGDELNIGFGELAGLSKLKILQVSLPDAECIPKNVEVEPGWFYFDIRIGVHTSYTNYKFDRKSRSLLLREITISTVPDWFIKAVTEKTEKLEYDGCKGMSDIVMEYDHGRLHKLKHLTVKGVDELKELMNTTRRVETGPVFENLEELHLTYLIQLEELCVGELPPGSLSNLKVLHMDGCLILKSVSKFVHRLPNLEKLYLNRMKEMEYVFGCEGCEPEQSKLSEMHLWNLKALRSICNGPGPRAMFQTLHSLSIKECYLQGSLFTSDVAQCLFQLKHVILEECPLLERIVEESNKRIVLPKLEKLGLSKLPMLHYESATFDIECPSLEEVHVKDCPKFLVSVSDFHSRNQVQLHEDPFVDRYRTEKQLLGDIVESVLSHTVGSEVFQETRQGMDTDDEVSTIGVYGTGGVGKTTMVIPSGSSSSSAVNWKYDVYLSFRGADTRKGFTSTLCDGLKKRGITTFMADLDLKVQAAISPSILTAIEESRFAIVVLSHAASNLCMEELTKICQLMEDGRLIILPVFYHVNPSDVRHQKGSFQDAFTKHERSGRYGSEKVQQWREALRKVGNLSGWLAQDYMTEIELIEAIVESVCSNIYTVGFVVFEETRRAMDEVMKALRDKEVAAIGVYGVGGVGKTTMVEHVCAKVWDKGMFHHVINAVVSKTPDLRKIQGTLADMLGLELEEETDIGRAHRLMQKIRRGSRILVILDDIWENIDLSNIGIPGYHELQRCNSKVLLITRAQNVLSAMGCRSNICLDVLSEKDSLTLFMNRARMSFESINSSDVAIKVARECAGLPIALIAVAKALGGKDNWEEAARRLKASPPANPENGKVVFNCIKLSYDYLAYDDARSFFLLCCLFPEDYDIQIEDLLKYGMGKGLFQDSSTMQDARASAHSVVKYLRDCSLLLESERDGCVKMHDVIRDVAIRISSFEDGRLFVKAGCQLKEWPIISAPDSYSAISLIRNKICKLPEKLVCLKLLILFLQSNVCLDEIPENFFQSLNVLRVLDLSQTRLSLLPTSFNLLINLHTLYLDGCLSIIDNISILGKLQKLEILSMRDLPLLELPEEIGLLSNLRMLDITGEYVDIVPSEVIHKLHGLEELYMQCNFADWRSEFGRTEVNWRKVDEAGEKNKAAFDELTSLSRLNILKVFISDANCLPKVVGVEPKWISFDICISENWSIRKVSLVSNSSPPYTRALTLGTTINALPVWFINVVTAKAEKLQYLMCWGLDNILVEYDLGRLHALKYFSVIGPSENLKILMNTTTLVQNGPVFQNLEELHLVRVDCLKELCVGELSQGSLCNLRLLKVNRCYKLVDALLPSQLLQRLENLEELICEEIDELEYVFGCEGLKPEQIILTKLKEMRLENLGKLKNIWNGPAPCTIFQNLHSLVVSGCFELENLFTADVAQCLLQLEDLSVESCPLLERVVEANKDTMDSKIVFPKLKNLALIKLPQLTRFHGNSESAIECPLLESLNVERCPQFSTSDFIAGIKSNICTLYEEGLVL